MTSSSDEPGAGRSSRAARSGTGTSTVTSIVFGVGGWTTSTGRVPARKVATSSSGRTVADRPMRWAGPGALEQRVEPLQRQREVRAALGARDRVHLVQDHRAHPAQRLPRGRGEQQEERFGRGDQHVRRRAREQPPLVRRGVAGAHPDRDVGRWHAGPLRRLPDPGERRAEVALHVDRQRLERRDVQDPAAVPRIGRWLVGGQPVERPQEGRERLARAGGRDHERVPARLRRRPRPLLGGRGCGEGPAEPVAGGGGEAVECAHGTDCASGHRQFPVGAGRRGRRARCARLSHAVRGVTPRVGLSHPSQQVREHQYVCDGTAGVRRLALALLPPPAQQQDQRAQQRQQHDGLPERRREARRVALGERVHTGHGTDVRPGRPPLPWTACA